MILVNPNDTNDQVVRPGRPSWSSVLVVRPGRPSWSSVLVDRSKTTDSEFKFDLIRTILVVSRQLQNDSSITTDSGRQILVSSLFILKSSAKSVCESVCVYVAPEKIKSIGIWEYWSEVILNEYWE